MPGESVEVLSFEIGREMEAWWVFRQTDKQIHGNRSLLYRFIELCVGACGKSSFIRINIFENAIYVCDKFCGME